MLLTALDERRDCEVAEIGSSSLANAEQLLHLVHDLTKLAEGHFDTASRQETRTARISKYGVLYMHCTETIYELPLGISRSN